jgi:hypothetical protein
MLHNTKSNKNVVIIDGDNARFKLTVTPTEIRIKVQAGVPESVKTEYINFLIEASNHPTLAECTQTWRGTMVNYQDEGQVPQYIGMATDNKKQTFMYTLT